MEDTRNINNDNSNNNDNNDETEERIYHALTPVKDAEKIEEYSNALNQALINDEVKNIAITGPYSSGKSSFIRSFIKKNEGNPKRKYLHISLASFFETDETEPKNLKKKGEKVKNKGVNKVRRISRDEIFEKRILKQLFYQADSKKIPHSRIGKIVDIDLSKLFLKVFIVTYCLFFIAMLSFPNKIPFAKTITDISECNLFQFYSCMSGNLLSILTWLIFILLFSLLILLILRYFQRNVITKINVARGELNTVSIDDPSSAFDANLDEILYFFKKHDYNTVVIEDLDRFDSHEIFVKFRELNKLVNSPVNNDDVPIKFIYAIGDDVLGSKDRVKFFDMMIPIIPYIHYSNSYNKIIEFFEKDLHIEDTNDTGLDQSFLSVIATHVHDLRLLKNIYNEYKIYEANVFPKLNKNNLLAIIVYKNFWPDCFSKLHNKEGDDYNLFKNKKVCIDDQKQETINLIEDLRIKIDERNEVASLDSDRTSYELMLIYYFKILETLNFNFKVLINGVFYEKLYTVNNTPDEEDFEQFINSESLNSTTERNLVTTFNEVENSVNRKLSFTERLDAIKNKEDKVIKSYKKEIADLEVDLLSLLNSNIMELINLVGENEYFPRNFEKKPLLRYFITNGYINEDYPNYISYFFKNSLTENDNLFLISLSDNISLGFDFKLNRIDELIRQKRVNSKSFKNDAILNSDLFKYLVRNKDVYTDLYQFFISKVADNSKSSIDFIFGLLEKDFEMASLFITDLVNEWHGFWLSAIDYISADNNEKYIRLLFENLTNESLEKINIEYSFTNSIDRLDKLKLFEGIDTHSSIQKLNSLNVEFERLVSHSNQVDLLELIYKHWLFKMNPENIFFILEVLFSDMGSEFKSELRTKTFTTIKKHNFEKLIDYIENDLSLFVEDVLLKIDTNIDESLEIITDLINSDELNNLVKIRIISKFNFIIKDIKSVDEDLLYPSLFEDGRVEINWSNLSHYYFKDDDIDVIKPLVEENYKTLSKSDFTIDTELDKEKFAKSLFELNSLSNSVYDHMVNNLLNKVEDIDLSVLDYEKVNILIKKGKLILSKYYVSQLEEYFEDSLHLSLISENIDEFFENYDDFVLNNSEYIELLKKQDYTNDQICGILKLITIDSLTPDESIEFSKSTLGIVENHKIILNSIFDYCFENLINESEKIKLFTTQIKNLTKEKISETLKKLSAPYKRLAYKGRTRPKIKANDINLELLEALKSVGFIKKYEIEKRKFRSDYYDVYRYW